MEVGVSMNKKLAVILALLFAVFLAACADQTIVSDEPGKETIETDKTPENTIAEESETEPEEEVKYEYVYEFEEYYRKFYNEKGYEFFVDYEIIRCRTPEELFNFNSPEERREGSNISVEHVFEGVVKSISFVEKSGVNWFNIDKYTLPEYKVKYWTLIEVETLKTYKGEEKEKFTIALPFGLPGYMEEEQKKIADHCEQPLYSVIFSKGIKLHKRYLFSVMNLKVEGEDWYAFPYQYNIWYAKDPEEGYLINKRETRLLKRNSIRLEDCKSNKDFFFNYNDYKAYIDSLG